MIAALEALRTEFDRLAADGRRIGLWWRDDDAVAETKALDRLLGITGAHDLALSLAVVPAALEPSLPARMAGEDDVTLLVHGWRHANHAAPGNRKAEFGSDRPLRELASEAGDGLDTVSTAFGPRCLPVFVPPWNRIAREFVPLLPSLGYGALSTFGEARAEAGIPRIDAHLDPVDWHGGRSLAAPEALVAMMRRALARGVESLGVLTHHRMFDEALWSFSEGLAALAADHPAIRSTGLPELMAQHASAPARTPASEVVA